MHFTCSIHCGAAASLHNSVKPVFLIQLVFSKYTIMCSTYIFQCKANKMCKSTRARPAHPAHISSKQLLQRYFAKMIVHWIRFSNDEANKQQAGSESDSNSSAQALLLWRKSTFSWRCSAHNFIWNISIIHAIELKGNRLNVTIMRLKKKKMIQFFFHIQF